MKKFKPILVLVLVLTTNLVCGARSGEDGIAVRLSLNQRQYQLGEKIRVAVRVENQGAQPLIISSLISSANNRQGYVDFRLTAMDGRHQRSQISLVGDTFAPFPKEVDWQSLLGQWMILYPGNAVVSHIDLDDTAFPFLMKPGRYKLSASYSSAGLSYPLNYRSIGLTAKDVASLRFTAWGGSVHSNVVWILIAPVNNASETRQK